MFVNPFKSKRFLTMLTDVAVSITLFFVGKYGAPNLFEDVKFLIVTLQPVWIFLIGAYAVEDFQIARMNPFRE